MREHLYEARGYDLPVMRRSDRLWRREVEPEFPSQVSPLPISIPLTLLKVRERALRTMRLLGLTDLLVPRDQPLLRFPGLRLVYDGPDGRIYRIEGALPRAFVADSQEVVGGGEAALNAFTRPGFDARRVVVTERPLGGLPRVGAGAAGSRGPAGSARIASYGPERVVLRAQTTRRGVLVLTDNYFPGWKATVDGRSVPVTQVDYLLRGVPLGPGSHTVVLRYQPLSWRIGWIVSVLSLAGLVLVLVIGLSRRRHRPPPGTPEPSRPDDQRVPAPS
jgi:hypothetical protein